MQKKNPKRHIYNAVIAVLVVIILYCGWQIGSQLWEYKKGDDIYAALKEQAVEEGKTAVDRQDKDGSSAAEVQQTEADPNRAELPIQNIDIAALKANINSDICGWIQGSNNGIDYPVVQGTDNNYYLEYTADKQKNKNGAIFVDYRNQMLKDDITIIYGHYKKNGSMFRYLDNYDEQEFLDYNPEMLFYTEEGIYRLRPFACYYTNSQEEIPINFSDEAAFRSYFDSVMRKTWITNENVDISYGDSLVCLYTCAFNRKDVPDGRFLLFAKAVTDGTP